MGNFGDTDVAVRAKMDMKALEQLIQHYDRFIWAIVRKFDQQDILAWRGLTVEDLYQEGVIGLIKAVKYYDPSRGGFSTLAWKTIQHTIAQRCRLAGDRRAKHGRPKDAISLSELLLPSDPDEAGNALEEFVPADTDVEHEVATRLDLAEALSRLTETQRKILKMQMLGYQLVEIADSMGVSHQAVQQCHKRALRRLQKALGA